MVGGVLRREGLGPAVERAGFSPAQQSPALRWTARVWSPGSTAGTPSAPAASIMPARRARRCGPMVSRRQLRPERVGGLTGAQPELTAVGVWRAPRGCGRKCLCVAGTCVASGQAGSGSSVAKPRWVWPLAACRLDPDGVPAPPRLQRVLPSLRRLPVQLQGIPQGWLGESWGCPRAVWPVLPVPCMFVWGHARPFLPCLGGNLFLEAAAQILLGPVYLLGGAWCSLRALVAQASPSVSGTQPGRLPSRLLDQV